MPITTIAIYFFIRPINCMENVAMEQSVDGRIRRIPQTAGRVFFEIFRIIINQGRLICFCHVNQIYQTFYVRRRIFSWNANCRLFYCGFLVFGRLGSCLFLQQSLDVLRLGLKRWTAGWLTRKPCCRLKRQTCCWQRACCRYRRFGNWNWKEIIELSLNLFCKLIQAAADGLYKQLGDKMRSQSKSRCVSFTECIELVKSGSYTYLNVNIF